MKELQRIRTKAAVRRTENIRRTLTATECEECELPADQAGEFHIYRQVFSDRGIVCCKDCFVDLENGRPDETVAEYMSRQDPENAADEKFDQWRDSQGGQP